MTAAPMPINEELDRTNWEVYLAGRKPKHQEFLLTLRDALGTDAKGLAKAIGKQTSNVSAYLAGEKQPGTKVIRSAVEHLSTWNVTVDAEVKPTPKNTSDLPTEPGIYALYDSAGGVIYVGQATNLQAEVRQALGRAVNFPIRLSPDLSKKKKPTFRAVTARLSAYVVRSKRLRHNLEALLLRVFANETHNNKLGKFR